MFTLPGRGLLIHPILFGRPVRPHRTLDTSLYSAVSDWMCVLLTLGTVELFLLLKFLLSGCLSGAVG